MYGGWPAKKREKKTIFLAFYSFQRAHPLCWTAPVTDVAWFPQLWKVRTMSGN
jgi:hypothetical protein